MKSENSKEKEDISIYYGLWKDLNDYLNAREDNSLKAALALVTVAGAFFIVDDGNDLKIILYYIAPLIMILILSYIAYLFRFVAILRGYLSGLEEKINDKLHEEAFMWNGPFVRVFISNNVPNIIIMICSMGIAIVVIFWIITSVFKGEVRLNDVEMFTEIGDDVMNIINYIYYPFLMLLLVVLVISFLDNNYVLRTSRELFLNKKEEEAIKSIKRLNDPKLSIRNRMKW